MLARLLLWVCLLSLNQDIHTRYNIGNVGKTAFYEYAYSLWIKIYIKGKVQQSAYVIYVINKPVKKIQINVLRKVWESIHHNQQKTPVVSNLL